MLGTVESNSQTELIFFVFSITISSYRAQMDFFKPKFLHDLFGASRCLRLRQWIWEENGNLELDHISAVIFFVYFIHQHILIIAIPKPRYLWKVSNLAYALMNFLSNSWISINLALVDRKHHSDASPGFFRGRERPGHLKAITRPRRASGGWRPRTVAKLDFLKRFKVLETESIFLKYQHFLARKIHFFYENFWKLNIFIRISDFFRKIILNVQFYDTL